MPWYWTDDIDDTFAAIKLFGNEEPIPVEGGIVAIRRPEASLEELLAALDEDEPPLAA